MAKSGFDHDALIQQFTQASTKQGTALRDAVQQATLKALQGRELTVKSIKDVLKTVTQATSSGVAASGLPAMDMEASLTRALDGMDAALAQAVEANRRALEQFVSQGAQLGATPLKKALSDIEQMEDVFYSAVDKAIADAGKNVYGPWSHVIESMKGKGSVTGTSATAAVEQITAQAREAARSGRKQMQSGAQAWMDHFAAVANGVLIGMSEGLSQGSAAAKVASRARKS